MNREIQKTTCCLIRSYPILNDIIRVFQHLILTRLENWVHHNCIFLGKNFSCTHFLVKSRIYSIHDLKSWISRKVHIHFLKVVNSFFSDHCKSIFNNINFFFFLIQKHFQSTSKNHPSLRPLHHILHIETHQELKIFSYLSSIIFNQDFLRRRLFDSIIFFFFLYQYSFWFETQLSCKWEIFFSLACKIFRFVKDTLISTLLKFYLKTFFE